MLVVSIWCMATEITVNNVDMEMMDMEMILENSIDTEVIMVDNVDVEMDLQRWSCTWSRHRYPICRHPLCKIALLAVGMPLRTIQCRVMATRRRVGTSCRTSYNREIRCKKTASVHHGGRQLWWAVKGFATPRLAGNGRQTLRQQSKHWGVRLRHRVPVQIPQRKI